MTPDEVNTLYAEYTERMEQSMGKGIILIATRIHTSFVKKAFPVGDHIAVQDELDNNPILQHTLSIIAGEVYHEFRLALAPLSVMFSTIQHVDVIQPAWIKQEFD